MRRDLTIAGFPRLGGGSGSLMPSRPQVADRVVVVTGPPAVCLPHGDRRVRRTRRTLQEAILELAVERDFDAITVAEITERADVNRATFYQHYRDKDELMARALDDLFEEVTVESRAFTAARPSVEAGTVPEPLVALFRHLEERRALYRRLFVGCTTGAFAGRLQLFQDGQFRRTWTEMGLSVVPGSPPAELRANVATNTIRAVVVWWLEPVEAAEAVPVETAAGWVWDLLSPLWFNDVERVAEHVSAPWIGDLERNLPLAEADATGEPTDVGAPRGDACTSAACLTPREQEVLRLVAAGRSNQEIADALFIGVPTVKRHLTTVYGKLGVGSRSALNTYAHDCKLA